MTEKDLERIRKQAGHYEPLEEKGKLGWDVNLGNGTGFLCDTEEDAQIMSMLAKIMKKLGLKP